MKNNKNIVNKLFSGKDVLDGLPELVYVFDKEGRLILWNNNIERVLGYSKKELLYKHISDFHDPNDFKRVLNEITKVFTDGKERTIEYNLFSKSGEKEPYLGSGSLMIVDGEEYLVGISINISKLKDVEKKLNNKIDEIDYLKNQLQSENIYLRDEIYRGYNFEDIIGESDVLKHILHHICQVAQTDTPVLLQGEIGVGKELFAKAIHNQSSRRNKPFIKVNCASLSLGLIETELFGFENKTFENVDKIHFGKVELANSGTLFLDRVGELPIETQSKLFRMLEEGRFMRTGTQKSIKIDIRIIASSNQNLEKLISQKLFRNDLFYHLNVYPIVIQPLRDRLTDIPLLTEHFLKIFNQKFNKNVIRIQKKTMFQLQYYSWPGNIRELKNIIERSVILSNTSLLKIESFVKSNSSLSTPYLSINDFEKEYIIKILGITFWRVGGNNGAAKILKMNPETLRSRMKKLGIKKPII